MAKPFFSIVIPALNEEKYLPHLLQDLADQSYRDFEVIVVDGNSEDKTVAKVKEYKNKLPKLTILTSEKRHVCTQRNLGAQKAQGEYLIFMDADNRFPSFFLLGLKYKLETEPSDLATTLTYTTSTKNAEISLTNVINTATELSKKIDNPVFLEAMTIIRRQLFLKIKGWNEKIDFSEGGDLLDKARALGTQHLVYKEPRYEYSLRRIRQYGALNLFANISIHQLAILFGENISRQQVKKMYPMKGGSLFTTPPRTRARKFVHTINQLLRKVSPKTPNLTLRRLKKEFSSLLP